MSLLNPNRRINYCIIDRHDKVRVILIVKWHKDNIYFINIHTNQGLQTKFSYHTPRLPSGKSQFNLKFGFFRPQNATALVEPIGEIKGIKYLGGSGIQFKEAEAFKNPGLFSEKRILDIRPYYVSHLSALQWYFYFVEPNRLDLFEQHKMIRSMRENDDFSELLHIDFIKNTTPWIAIAFTRIRDENPIWYKDLK